MALIVLTYSLRTTAFIREPGLGTILVAVRRLTRLVGNGNRDMRHSFERS